MPLLHIDPEEMQVIARRLMLAAEEIDWQVRQIENVRQLLQAVWHGDSRWQFETEMNYRLHALRQLSREIAELSIRLQREAVRWEQIGHRF